MTTRSLRLITEGCWTEPTVDSWERRKARKPCQDCGRMTRGVYLIDGVEAEAMCAQCAVKFHDGPGPQAVGGVA